MKNVFLALILFCIMTGLAKGKTPLYYGPKKNLEFKVHDPSFQVATTVITLASSTPGVQFHFPLTLDDVTATSTPTGGAVLYSLNGELVELREDGTETVITDTPTALLSSTSELTTSGGAVILSATSSGDYTFTFPSAAGASGETLTADGNGGHTYEAAAGVTVQSEGWVGYSGRGSTNTKIPYGIISATSTNPGGGLFTLATSTTIGTEVTFNVSNLEVTACISYGQTGEFGITLNSERLTTNIITVAQQQLDEIICITHASGGGGQNVSNCCDTFFPESGQVLRPHDVGQTPTSNIARFTVTAKQR